MNKKFKEIYNYEADMDVSKEWDILERKLDSKKKRRLALWYWLGGGSFALSVIVFFYFGAEYSPIRDDRQDHIRGISALPSQEQAALLNPDLDVHDRVAQDRIEQGEIVDEFVELTLTNKSTFIESDIEEITVNDKQGSTAQSIEESKGKSESDNISSVSVFSEKLALDIPTVSIIDNVQVDAKLKSTNSLNTGEYEEGERSIAKLERLASIPRLEIYLSGMPYKLTASIEEVESLDDRSKGLWLMGFTTSYGLVNRQLSNVGASDLYYRDRLQLEKSLDEVKASIVGQYQRHNKVIESGLEIGRIAEVFEFKGTRILTSQQDNQLVSQYTDSRGVTVDEFGTQVTKEKYEVNVTSYNHLTYISLPLLLGYNIQKARYSIQPKIGMASSIYLGQRGIAMNQEGIPVAMGQDFARSIGVKAMTRVDIFKSLKNGSKLGLGLYAQSDVLGQSIQPGLNYKYSSMGLNVIYLPNFLQK